MNNYVAMTMVYKGQRQNYFRQQGIHVSFYAAYLASVKDQASALTASHRVCNELVDRAILLLRTNAD